MARCRRFPRPYAGIASRVTWYLQWPKIQRLSPPRMAIASRSLPFHRSSRGRTPRRSAGRRSAVTPRRLGGPGAFGDTAEAAGAEGGDREGTARGWASPLHSDREGDRGGGQAAAAGSSRSPGFPSHAARSREPPRGPGPPLPPAPHAKMAPAGGGGGRLGGRRASPRRPSGALRGSAGGGPGSSRGKPCRALAARGPAQVLPSGSCGSRPALPTGGAGGGQGAGPRGEPLRGDTVPQQGRRRGWGQTPEGWVG